MIFDENGPLSMERELEIFKRVEDTIKVRYPKFRIRIIACSLKALGPEHLQKTIDSVASAENEPGNYIVGFDAVMEEDYNTHLD